MKARAVIIPVDREPYVADVSALPDGESLSTLQEIVGGFIEYLPVGEGAHAYINEEGKLDGLPMNPTATLFMRGIIAPSDYIAGPMVILGETPDGGEADCPARILKRLGL